MKTLRSVFFYFTIVWSTVLLGASAVVLFYATRKHAAPHACSRLWGKVHLWAAGVRVEVKGLENIDPTKPCIYAANHQSWFDIFAILAKLPVQFRWLAKEELFKIPVLGIAMTANGYIPIDRSDRRKAFASLNRAALIVQNGASIVIFPEGTRSPDGVLQDFRMGGFVLALKSQQPIVPISISGSYRILPKHGGWKIHPGVIQMTIGAPIPTAGLTSKDREDLVQAVRQAIRAHLTEREGGLLPDHSSV